MSKHQFAFFALIATLALFTPACGGGSSGASGGSGSGLLIQSTSIPPAESGGLVNYIIDLEGGCGGPYDVQLLSGALPLGVAIIDKDTWDDDRYEGEGFTQFEHRLFGSPLEDGTYTFDIQLVDTGCTPFASATASYVMRVSVGQVCVVTVEQDGNPALIPTGETDYNPDHPALPKVVYNDFTSLQFIIAGGVGPYALKIWDDPNIPDDGNLPLGVSLAATSIVGSPVQVGPDGGPFLCSFEITDSVGETTYFTAYWKIDTPVIIVATESIADGQAGKPYSDTFIVAGGVPPFDFEFVEVGMPEDYTSDANPNPSNPDADVLYNPGAAPTVNPPEALNKIDGSSYPAQNDLGPDYDQSNQGIPSEGIYIIEESGSFSGIPRRRGTYSVNMHVKSGLVPNSFGQHAWATYGFEILQSGPIAQDPSYTLEPAFAVNPPYAQIQGADQGESYNPDGGVDGLQLLANGGVPQDGRTDAPHYSQTDDDPTETYGAYTWEVDWDPDDEGNDPVPAMELTPDGRFKIQDGQEDDLVPMMDRALGFNAIDYALPVQLATTKAEKVRFGIGPDRAIVLESSTSFTPATVAYDNRYQNDTDMALKVLTARASGADSLDPIGTEHLVGTGDGKILLPEDAGDIKPADLFKGMDTTRISVNPTGWWDDSFHLNPRAARPFQHGDRNSGYAYYGLGYHGTTSATASTYYLGKYMYQPTATCVRLPSASSVKADRASGVYNDGGKFYIFETKTHIGVFVIRPDTGIYVPAAYDKDDTGWVSFGDNWGQEYQSNVSSGVKIPQMTVSPDGRVAALKLRSDAKYNRLETASSTAILLISLTGERMFDGEVSKVIETGSNGTSAQGQYQFASSLTLTNDYLYYIIGSGSTTYLSWRDHYIYRYELDSGDDAGALLHSKFNSEWTNTSGSAMQMPFQRYYNDFLWSASVPNPHPLMYAETGYNCHEVPTAPHPFRVNANGNACAILAGVTTTQTSGTAVLKHHVWVDYEGELTQLSETLRRTSGGGAGTQLWSGPMNSPCAYQWGSYNGPTTRFEISDDGQKVAVSYKRNTTSYGSTSYSSTRYHYREDIAAFVTTDGWQSHKIHEITGDSSTSTNPSGGKFKPSTVWRFGALTFTADGGGLIFWGGRSNYGPTTVSSSDYYMYYGAKSFVGSLYSYDFSDSSVRNILGSKEGGAKDTVGSALTSINYSTSSWQIDGGVIKPFGGFISKNRNFLYISNKGALTTSDTRDGMLIGVNIRSLNTSNSINGHTDGRAFVVDGFASLNSFIDGGYAYHYLGGLGYYYNYPGYNWYYVGAFGDTLKGAATDNGWVFFTSTNASGYAYAAQSNTYGGAVNATYYTYPYYPKKMYVFDPNVGGDMQQIASAWGGQASYAMVGCVEVADDGHTIGCVYSASAYYNQQDKEKLSVWTNIELDASGELDYDLLTENHVESSQGYVGSHFAFGPNNVDVYYAQGSGNENQQELKKAAVDGGTPSAFSLPKKNYNVLHAGR